MSQFKEGRIPFKGYETYYCVVGECKEGKKPLLALHGGPGTGSAALRDLDTQASFGRSVIYYDQLGSGASQIPSAPHLWKAELWVDELLTVIDALELTEFHLLGHSWGGMLALQAMIEKRPAGVRSLTLSSAMASTSVWCEEGLRLASYLPPEISRVIFEAEEKGLYEGEAYGRAIMEFYRRHLCTLDPMPDFLLEFFSGEPNESYLTAWGPSEFTCSGTLKGWDYRGRLGEITVPTLVLSGLMDECTPLVAKNLYDGIAGSRWELFEHSGHMTYVEEKEKYTKVLAAFLAEHD